MKRTNLFKSLCMALILALALGCVSLTAFAASEEAETAGTRGEKASEEIAAAVSEEDALAAALKDARLAEEDVTVTRTRLSEKTDEDGKTAAVYTFKFHTEDTTYKYHVDANTGKVIDSTVTEGVETTHSRGGHSKASGEMTDEASDEMTDEASGEMTSEHSGRRSAKAGGRGIDAETGATPDASDSAGV